MDRLTVVRIEKRWEPKYGFSLDVELSNGVTGNFDRVQHGREWAQCCGVSLRDWVDALKRTHQANLRVREYEPEEELDYVSVYGIRG